MAWAVVDMQFQVRVLTATHSYFCSLRLLHSPQAMAVLTNSSHMQQT